MCTLDTSRKQSRGHERLATALNTLTTGETELMLLCSAPNCCESDPIFVRFRGETTREGPP